MGKPDLQKVFVTPAGQAYRDDGDGSFALAFGNLAQYASPAAAAAGGVPVGGLYVLTTNSGIVMRLS